MFCFPALVHLGVQFIFGWLVSCSKRLSISEDWELSELTEQSLSLVTRHLTNGPNDPLVIKLRDCVIEDELYQQLCLKYLIGSAAIFAKVNEEALIVIRNLCEATRIECLSDLIEELIKKNDCSTVARFIAANSWHLHRGWTFGGWIAELMKRDWSVIGTLVMEISAALRGNTAQYYVYCHLLKGMTVGRQYQMFNTGEIPLGAIGFVYSMEALSPFLREVFALARCSYSQNPAIRKVIAAEFPYFRQFLPEGATDGIEPPSPARIPALDADSWQRVFAFLDVETLAFALPLVCVSWNRLYPTILQHCTKVHDLYLHDLNSIPLSEIHKIAPWKYHLSSVADALQYFGQCAVDGALNRAPSKWPLTERVRRYFAAVMSGKTLIPKLPNCTSTYDSFLKLFEMVYSHDANSKPVLDKPGFLSDDEYERAVHHFVCEKGWILTLSKSLIISNIPKLFGIVREDEELMKRLIRRQFGDFVDPSIILVEHGQTSGLPTKLARAIFSQTDLFRKFIEPQFIEPGGYYSFIVDSGILLELILTSRRLDRLYQLMISLILFFKDCSEKLDKIVGSIVNRFSRPDNPLQEHVLQLLQERLSKLLETTSKYSPEEVGFLGKIVMRFSLSKEPET